MLVHTGIDSLERKLVFEQYAAKKSTLAPICSPPRLDSGMAISRTVVLAPVTLVLLPMKFSEPPLSSNAAMEFWSTVIA